MESIQDMSGCGANQKVKLMRKELCPNNKSQMLESEFWCYAMVGAGHATYTDCFHKLSRLFPHLVTPKNKSIKRNGSLRKNTKKRGNDGELSMDGNAKDDNKRSRTGRAFATVTNPVRKEYTGTAPKAGPRMVTPLNARNLSTTRGACFECGGRRNNGNQAHRGAFMMGSEEPKHYDGVLGEKPEEKEAPHECKDQRAETKRYCCIRSFPEVFPDDLSGLPPS
ncbi:hypothetical protein Tco_1402022 [Tanacetum coccineum]